MQVTIPKNFDTPDPFHNPPLRGDIVRIRELRETREAAGLSQEQAAVYSGCGRNTLQRLESGASSPRIDTLRRLLDVYGSRLGKFLPVGDYIDG
jgi:transcriptional regulator with XRE-family HTH domain